MKREKGKENIYDYFELKKNFALLFIQKYFSVVRAELRIDTKSIQTRYVPIEPWFND